MTFDVTLLERLPKKHRYHVLAKPDIDLTALIQKYKTFKIYFESDRLPEEFFICHYQDHYQNQFPSVYIMAIGPYSDSDKYLPTQIRLGKSCPLIKFESIINPFATKIEILAQGGGLAGVDYVTDQNVAQYQSDQNLEIVLDQTKNEIDWLLVLSKIPVKFRGTDHEYRTDTREITEIDDQVIEPTFSVDSLLATADLNVNNNSMFTRSPTEILLAQTYFKYN